MRSYLDLLQTIMRGQMPVLLGVVSTFTFYLRTNFVAGAAAAVVCSVRALQRAGADLVDFCYDVTEGVQPVRLIARHFFDRALCPELVRQDAACMAVSSSLRYRQRPGNGLPWLSRLGK